MFAMMWRPFQPHRPLRRTTAAETSPFHQDQPRVPDVPSDMEEVRSKITGGCCYLNIYNLNVYMLNTTVSD